MSKRNKLDRFSDNDQAKNVIQEGKELFETIKGNWTDFFGNDNPITLELGCGYGEYSVGLGTVHPDRNFIGIDIKGARIWRGSQDARINGLDNVAFLRTQLLFLDKFFEKGEVDEIWVTFPDPRIKDGDERRRLISPRYLKMYNKVLKDGGTVHLKTDNTFLYDYCVPLLEELGMPIQVHTRDLYKEPELHAEHHGLKTRYENLFYEQGETIKYIRFNLTDDIVEKVTEW